MVLGKGAGGNAAGRQQQVYRQAAGRQGNGKQVASDPCPGTNYLGYIQKCPLKFKLTYKL